jgi:hypothetical protein
MISEDYVGFEISQLLREKGFDEKCEKVWMNDGKLVWACNFMEGESFVDTSDIETQADYDGWITYLQGQYAFLCPSLNVALKWLILEHKIYIRADYIDFLEHGEVWAATIIMMKTFKEIKVENTEHTKEEALEFALEYALTNLI